MAGAGAGGIMVVRNGPKAMAASAVMGGVLLAMIEGIGVMMNKYQAQMMRAPPEQMPQDPMQLDLKGFQQQQ